MKERKVEEGLKRALGFYDIQISSYYDKNQKISYVFSYEKVSVRYSFIIRCDKDRMFLKQMLNQKYKAIAEFVSDKMFEDIELFESADA